MGPARLDSSTARPSTRVVRLDWKELQRIPAAEVHVLVHRGEPLRQRARSLSRKASHNALLNMSVCQRAIHLNEGITKSECLQSDTHQAGPIGDQQLSDICSFVYHQINRRVRALERRPSRHIITENRFEKRVRFPKELGRLQLEPERTTGWVETGGAARSSSPRGSTMGASFSVSSSMGSEFSP